MSEEWLIDGYNLLHFISAQKNPGDCFPSTKTSLCAALAGMAATRKHKIWIVLDGIGNPDELKTFETAYFQAVYSQKVSADHHIEKYIYQNKAATVFVVVTDDRTITGLARGGGARVLKNSQFLEMLRQEGKEKDAALLNEKVRSHGFNRPFDEKFKSKGF